MKLQKPSLELLTVTAAAVAAATASATCTNAVASESNNENECDVFSQINEEVGYWRSFGFGIVSMYKSDLKAVGGLDTSILGWGGEDVDLYEKVQLYRLSVT